MGTLAKDSQDCCADALRKYGFKPKERGVLLQVGSTKQVTGWLVLNLATWSLPAVLHVNPVVGVRHLPLERALVDLAGWNAPVPAVSRPIGYLMPQQTFVQWDFPAGGDLAAVARDLADAVATYGQPFIDLWSDWTRFSADVASSGLLLDVQRHIVLPIVAAVPTCTPRATAASLRRSFQGRRAVDIRP